MPELNAVGDLVLKDARAMRALADASRLALHDLLHRRGPATAEELAPLLGADPDEITEALTALEDVELVERVDGDARWAAVGKGLAFEIPDDPEGQHAARQLSNVMLLQYVDLPRRWVSEDEPRLPLEWARAAGMLNVRLVVTPDELRRIQEQLEQLLEPLITREPAAFPEDGAYIRLLSYFLPEPPEEAE
jgi:DNA-binding transcriptional ArsR family regulator